MESFWFAAFFLVATITLFGGSIALVFAAAESA
jgi:hypothetical protein